MALDNTPATAACAFTLDAPALKKALTLAALVTEKKSGIPILRANHFNVTPGAVNVLATDLDMALTITIPADTADHGQAVFNPKMFLDGLAGAKGKASILFDGLAMVMDCNGFNSESKEGYHVEDFPKFSPSLFQTRAEIAAPDLLAGLTATLPAVSTEEARYYLNGVLFHGWQDNKADATLRLVSTDGHRLARFDLPCPWPYGGKDEIRAGMILPTKAAAVLARLVKESKGATIEIATDHRHELRFMFSGPGWRLETKAVDGTFPDYTRVIPVFTPVSKAIKIMICESDLPPAPHKSRVLALKFDAESGKMSWGGDENFAYGARDVLISGAGAVGFNCRYLRDFAAIAPDGLEIDAATDGAPCLVKTADSRFLGVVMPMRV